MSDLFISYASADRERAEALHARLTAEGFEVWFDRTRLVPGTKWHKEIEAACEAARAMLPLITPNWKHSEWTRYETYVHDAILPILAEGDPKATLTPPLRALHGITLDPLKASEEQWQELFAALRQMLAKPVPERAPRIVDLPYPANPFFTGREDDLVRLHEALHEAPVAALTQGRVSAIAAMGGIGKTTLANEYARRYWRLYPQILWLDSRRGYESEYARLFDRLFPERAQSDLKPDEKARQALAELNGQAERLLVIDNAEDAESARPWLPREAISGCRTLITSRFADWPRAEGIRAVNLYVLEPEPARTFLVGRTGRAAEGAEREACDALAKALGYLPLALEQAGAYIAAPGAGLSFADYLRLFEAATTDLLGRDAPGSTGYPVPVLGTWRMTVAKLSPESRAVLRLCAWLADTPIPRQLILEGADDVLALAGQFGEVGSPPANAAAAELRMRDALTGLARYSMILDPTDDTFRIHGLVQAVERAQAAADTSDSVSLETAVARVHSLFPDDVYDNVGTWPLCGLLQPHVLAVVEREEPVNGSLKLAQLLEATGRFRHGSGFRPAAKALLNKALDVFQHATGLNSTETAGCRHNLAHCLIEMGEYEPASALLRDARDVYERQLGRNHSNTLRCLNDLAGLSYRGGNFLEAEQTMRTIVDRAEATLGSDHTTTLLAVNNLAYCLQALGDIASALPLCRRALEASERVHGLDHPRTLASVNNLVNCLNALGDTAPALLLCRRALETSERVLGKDHPGTLDSMTNLADCLVRVGQVVEGAELWSRALEARSAKQGRDHPDVLRDQNNLGVSLRQYGHPDLAEPYARACAEASDRVLGAADPLSAHRRNNVALTLLMLRRVPEARALLASNWAQTAMPVRTVTPAIAFLNLVAALLDAVPIADPIGRLKALLLGPPLIVGGGIAYLWDVAYLLDWLEKDMPPEDLALLRALLAAINEPEKVAALDGFGVWRDTAAVPLDTPWPA